MQNGPQIRIEFCQHNQRSWYRLSYRRGQLKFGHFATKAEAVEFRNMLRGNLRSHADVTAACARVAGGAA